MKIVDIIKSVAIFFENGPILTQEKLFQKYGVNNQEALNKAMLKKNAQELLQKFNHHVNQETIIEISAIQSLTYSDDNYTEIKTSIIDGSFKRNIDYPWSIMTDILQFYQVLTDRNIYVFAEVEPFDPYLNRKILWVHTLPQKIISADQYVIFSGNIPDHSNSPL